MMACMEAYVDSGGVRTMMDLKTDQPAGLETMLAGKNAEYG